MVAWPFGFWLGNLLCSGIHAELNQNQWTSNKTQVSLGLVGLLSSIIIHIIRSSIKCTFDLENLAFWTYCHCIFYNRGNFGAIAWIWHRNLLNSQRFNPSVSFSSFLIWRNFVVAPGVVLYLTKWFFGNSVAPGLSPQLAMNCLWPKCQIQRSV